MIFIGTLNDEVLAPCLQVSRSAKKAQLARDDAPQMALNSECCPALQHQLEAASAQVLQLNEQMATYMVLSKQRYAELDAALAATQQQLKQVRPPPRTRAMCDVVESSGGFSCCGCMYNITSKLPRLGGYASSWP
jgi:hypothetical protein